MEVYGCVLYVVDVIEVLVMILFVLDAFFYFDFGEVFFIEFGLFWILVSNDRIVWVCVDY